MECDCHLRNVQDLSADSPTPYERRFNSPFEGRMFPFGVEENSIHHPGKTKVYCISSAQKSFLEYSSDTL